MVEESLGLRERKKLQRRHEIEVAALDLFEADGFEQTTIDAITAKVRISPRTFFYYFSTKEDVVLADYARRLARIIEEVTQQPDDLGPWASLRVSFVVVAADYETEREQLIRRFGIIAANPSVYARSLQLQAGWEDALTEVLSERIDRSSGPATDPPRSPAIEPRLLAASALALMRSSIRHWLETGCQVPLPPLVDECFEQLAVGLSAVGQPDRGVPRVDTGGTTTAGTTTVEATT